VREIFEGLQKFNVTLLLNDPFLNASGDGLIEGAG
jgi:hypothetical protein